MTFKLLIIGHDHTLRIMENYIITHFTNIKLTTLHFRSDGQLDTIAQKLKEELPHQDAILYTHPHPYLLLSKLVEHTCPTRYLDMDPLTISGGLIRLINQGIDITKISYDSISEDELLTVFDSAGYSPEDLLLYHVNEDIYQSGFIQRIIKEHIKNYSNKLCTYCVTSIRQVWIELTQRDIPCIIAASCNTFLVYEIKRLMLSSQLNKQLDNKIVSIFFSLLPQDPIYLLNSTTTQEVRELSIAQGLLAEFTQLVNGALISSSQSDFYLFCNSDTLFEVTERLAKLTILSSIPKSTCYDVCMGIGFGENARSAKVHSNVAYTKSLSNGGSCAYAYFSPEEVLGPIEPSETFDTYRKIFDPQLLDIAQRSGISVNMIYKLDQYIAQTRSKTFTCAELADGLNVSVRTANRMVLKLEDAGFVHEVSRHVTGSTGRPTRVLKVRF
ncbi:MAG: hypothetical protein RR364_02390 [Lachnospiraceae bacterium]